jgi:enoyl-CoA hydratase
VQFREQDGIGWMTLNRPEALNALNQDALLHLSALLDRAKSNDAIKAVILTGAGDKAFSAGADIGELNRATPLEVRDVARLAVIVTHKIENLGKVVVAALNGFALGGGLEVAESCTLRLAARHAKLGHPEVRIGAIAGWGGSTRLPRLIGKGRAAELLLTGDLIDAEEAQRIGLVTRVTGAEALPQDAERLVRRILAQSPVAVKLTWEAVHRGLNLTWEESTLLGADYFGLVASTDDFREGTRAFLDKSAPTFVGR